jgi:hypothetical protein
MFVIVLKNTIIYWLSQVLQKFWCGSTDQECETGTVVSRVSLEKVKQWQEEDAK